VAVIGAIALFVAVAVSPHLFIGRWLKGRQPRESLLERLQPYPPKSVADEAQCWLEEQHG
jgi:hypothetical protein